MWEICILGFAGEGEPKCPSSLPVKPRLPFKLLFQLWLLGWKGLLRVWGFGAHCQVWQMCKIESLYSVALLRYTLVLGTKHKPQIPHQKPFISHQAHEETAPLLGGHGCGRGLTAYQCLLVVILWPPVALLTLAMTRFGLAKEI